MYIVRFVRWDRQPNEEYCYHNLCDALVHMSLFKDDDSGLYAFIEVAEFRDGQEVIVTQKTFKMD